MKLVAQLLGDKGSDVWSVTPNSPVFDALSMMADKNCGAVLVLESQKLVGILSERDYARKVVLKGKSSRDTRVNEIMSQQIVYVRPDQTIDECMALMTGKRVRHLPVLQEEKLVGLISIGDVVKAVISEQEFLIQELENYITGTPMIHTETFKVNKS